MKVVFDTNVLVAAFVAEDICSVLLSHARKKEVDLIVCPKILEEFEKVLKEKLKVPEEIVQEALNLILEASQLVHPAGTAFKVCRDEDDNQILACALSAKADYLVSGDRNLLKIGSFKKLKIVSPREFESLFQD